MTTQDTSPKHLVLLILALILILGAGLRFYRLDYQSLWNDELSTWIRSNQETLAEVMDQGVRSDVHPPAYLALMFFTQKTLGDSEVDLRLPSAIFGLLSVAAMYAVGRRLYSVREGLMAAAFMAVFLAPIYASQEARPYAMVLFFSLVATYFWLDMVAALYQGRRPAWLVLAAYWGSAVLTCYTHYYGVLFIGFQALGALLFFARRRQALLLVLALYGAVLLAYLPWLPLLADQLSASGPPRYPKPDAGAPLDYLRFLFNDATWLVLGVLLLYGYLLVVDVARARRGQASAPQPWPIHPDLLLALWLVLPFMIGFLVSIAWQPVLLNRNLTISLPAAYLLLARSITQLPVRPRFQNVLTGILVAFLAWHLIVRVEYYTSPQKEQIREAVAFVTDLTPRYEDAIVIGYAWSPGHVDYYLNKLGNPQRVALLAGRSVDVAVVRKTVDTQDPHYVWYIAVHRVPDQDFLEALSSDLHLMKHASYYGAEVWLYERR